MRTAAATAAALALALLAVPASAADTKILLVHGYGDSAKGKDCNGGTWRDALRHHRDATTIGYYPGDKGRCDVMIGDGTASNERPIQHIARDLAIYIDETYTSTDRPVNVVAHSMGGLVTRVALLGSAQGWHGFPSRKLNVDNVVTLSTPHQGVAHPSAVATRQWEQMAPGSDFMKRLHEKGSGLGDDWAAGTDWTLVGSHDDATVKYASGIDKGAYADQKFGYRNVDHTGIRTRDGASRYDLTYWHAAGDHPPHHTENGWSPLKTAFRAATKVGDGLPK